MVDVSGLKATGKRKPYIAHFVIRTAKYQESVAWYRVVFEAKVVFANDMVTFLTFDDEHHRIAIGTLPELEPHSAKSSGVDHIAFSFGLPELVSTYDRLKAEGILPYWSINHGPTTSLYYHDPDGVQIELQTDNIAFPGGASAFFHSEDFSLNPIGVEFDAEAWSARFHAGEDADSLLQRPRGEPAKIG